MFNFDNENSESPAKIKVVGIGGSGINAVNYMIEKNFDCAEFITIDTDEKALENSQALCKIKFEDRAEIEKEIAGSDLIFIVAGIGGITATKIAPVIAEIAKSAGALTVAVVIKENADIEIKNLVPRADTVITISGDEILFETVKAVSGLVTMPGIVNLDFTDLKTILTDSGNAFVGIGEASGEKAVEKASKIALNFPALNGVQGAGSILISFTGAANSFSMQEVHEASMTIQDAVNEDAEIMWGMSIDENLGDTVRATIIATRFEG